MGQLLSYEQGVPRVLGYVAIYVLRLTGQRRLDNEVEYYLELIMRMYNVIKY